MTAYSKYNIIYRLQKWLDSVPGQTFLNYAYSWGASVVILGTLFKLTHLPGANIMLYIGMGTEVVVFFISAFDRPFDKTADGKDLPTHVEEDENNESPEHEVPAFAPAGVAGGGTIIIGGGNGSVSPTPMQQTAFEGTATSEEGGATVVGGGVAAEQTGAPITFAAPQAPAASPEMEEATANYVDALNNLTEMLSKVSEQSQRLTRDSEEMENLNRTLTGICKVYEMQLKGASAQIGTIDQINEQTRHMAAQIAELNNIYARMIEAMTVNMPKV